MLKYGALPLTFEQQEALTVSPTLGTDQLKAGLLAGGIGVVLVFVYSLLYYRALGLIMIASLILSGVLVYAVLVILGRQIGFTLTLAGVAGFIVAIGITADSFVVFFERLKDEIRDGRSPRSAVPRAWVRARRTILSADAVSFLAAAILYYLAAGSVKGFAFTLGLSTVLDLVIVFLFTHPIVALAARSKTFMSPRFSGLGAVQRVAAAAGRARPRPPRPPAAARPAGRRGRARRRSPDMLTLFRRLNAGEAVFDFIGSRKRWYWVSVALLLICVASFVFRGFNLGIEFSGGTSFQFRAVAASRRRCRRRPRRPAPRWPPRRRSSAAAAPGRS